MRSYLKRSTNIDSNIASDKNTYFPAIDGLRAIAVLAVILFHLEIELFSGGFVGVDIFFVISGYLITRKIHIDLQNHVFSFKTFYYSRIRRLFPAVIATAIISLIISVLLFSPEHLKLTAESAIASVFSVANIYFWNISGYFDSDATLKPFLHFWSLSVEEQFYLFWPALLVLLFKTSRNSIVTITTLIFLALLSIYLTEISLKEDQDFAFYWVHLRVSEFIFGAILIWIERYSPNPIIKTAIFLLGILLIIYSILAFSSATVFPGLNSLVPCLGAACIIYAKDSFPALKLLANRPAVFVGKISYSLYLVHWPIWVFYTYWVFNDITSIEKLGLFIVIFIIGNALYKHVENRYRLKKSKDQAQPSGQYFSALLIILCLLITIPALNIISSEGWSWRTENAALHRNRPFTCENLKKIENKSLEKKCLLGKLNEYKAKVLIIGDSHAEHLRFGLHDFGIRNSVKFEAWTFAGCPPIWQTYKIYGLHSRTPLPRQAYCKNLIKEWKKKIDNSEYDAVIISSRWMWLHEPTTYGERKPLRRDLLVDITKPSFSIESSRELFASRILDTVSDITKNGTKAIIFSQVPLLVRNVQGCDQVPHWLYSQKKLKTRCDPQIDYKSQLARLEYTNNIIKSLRNKNILPIIPSDYICTQQKELCHTLINNRSIYLDDNHLNVYGSQYLIEMISEELKGFLNLSPTQEFAQD
ncbi:MAG: acyltransferase family protein [Arenicella sp.]